MLHIEPQTAGPRRPVMRWLGGKWVLAPRIIAKFPPHRIYTEPFCGAASVLMRKPRSYAEVINDVDSDVCNLFSVLRDETESKRLIELLHLTPFAREEFELAYEPSEDRIEQVRRMVVRSYLGFGSESANVEARTGFRANSNRSGTTPAHDWANYPEALPAIVERLRGVIIENRPAVSILRAHDSEETLHYLDPPYMPETRSPKSRKGAGGYHRYRHEMEVSDHEELLDAILELKGMIVISGYASALYDGRLGDWERIEMDALADGARPRKEVLWLSPSASSAARRHAAGPLFNLEAVA